MQAQYFENNSFLKVHASQLETIRTIQMHDHHQVGRLFKLSNCTQNLIHIGKSKAHYHSSSSTRPLSLGFRVRHRPSEAARFRHRPLGRPDYHHAILPMIVQPSNDFMKIIIHLQLVMAHVRLHVVRMTHKPAEAQESLQDVTQCSTIDHTGQASRPYFIQYVTVDFVSRIKVSLSSAVPCSGPRNSWMSLDCTEIAHEFLRTSTSFIVWPHLLEVLNQRTITFLLTIPSDVAMEPHPELNWKCETNAPKGLAETYLCDNFSISGDWVHDRWLVVVAGSQRWLWLVVGGGGWWQWWSCGWWVVGCNVIWSWTFLAAVVMYITVLDVNLSREPLARTPNRVLVVLPWATCEATLGTHQHRGSTRQLHTTEMHTRSELLLHKTDLGQNVCGDDTYLVHGTWDT